MDTLTCIYLFNESHTGDSTWMPSESSKKVNIFNQLDIIDRIENIEVDTQRSLEEKIEVSHKIHNNPKPSN